MHRLRKTAIALALGETVALSSIEPASAQTAAQPIASGQPSGTGVPAPGTRADEATTTTASSASRDPQMPPANVNGGYTWRNKAPTHKAQQHKQKVDPSRAQAKGPEFTIGSDGTSHISLQLSQRVEVSLSSNRSHLVFELPNTQVAVPNDSNPLVTTHFSTPVKAVRLLTRGRNARLLVELREPASPEYQIRQLAGGAVSLEVSLPKSLRSTSVARAEHGQKPRSPKSRK